ncbi:hypothetical protein HJC23_000124 [Cyclotella cryptica]|uniref:Uncharacterized protein n=1 Tax=Cyclotella cryptica TaxID=29204 RepID=A0ABD3NXG2_9STRA
MSLLACLHHNANQFLSVFNSNQIQILSSRQDLQHEAERRFPTRHTSAMETHPISFTFADDDPPFPSSHSPLRRPHAKPSSPHRPAAPHATASSGHLVRPATPPPRSLLLPPSQQRPSQPPRGITNDDARSASSPIVHTMLTRLGRASTAATFSYDPNESETNNMSDLSFSSQSAPSIYSQHNNDDDDDDDNHSLNLLQQHAMEEFLQAHMSGSALAKEEKWRELVRVMRDSSHGGKGRPRPRGRQRHQQPWGGGGQRRSSSSRSASSTSRSSRGSQRSWTNDEILGFIRIGGTPGGGDSIASALTSPTSSPHGRGFGLGYYGSSPLGSSSPPVKPVTTENANIHSPPRTRRDIFLNFKGSETSEGTAEESLPTFPSLPGCHEASLSESLPTVPPLGGGGRRLSSSNEDEFVYSNSMEDDSVRDSSSASSNGSDSTTGSGTSAISNEEKGGVFLDIGLDATNSMIRSASKESKSYRTTSNSTWDSLLMSSDFDDPSCGTWRSGGGGAGGSKSSSIVKNLIGRYETTINRSVSSSVGKEPSFFQRTNQEVIQSQKLTVSHRRIVSASNPTTPRKEVSHQSQTSQKLNRKSRRENTLEEQVRTVLEMQHSHTVRDEVEGHIIGSHDPDNPSSRPITTPNKLTRSTKSESVTSAQDILAELRRSPTPSSLQSGVSFNSGGSRSSLPRKISIGGGAKSPLNAVPNSISPGENAPSPDRCGVRTPSPLALAPSKRDLPRPNRINRKTASEPSAAGLRLDVGAVNDSISSNSIRSSLPETSTQIEVHDGPSTSVPRPRSKVFPCTSPLTIASNDNRNSIGTPTEKATELPTTPLRVKTHPTNYDTQDSHKKASSPAMNQSGEPSRTGFPPSTRNMPPTPTTRRILPSVKEIAARFNGQMKSDPSSSPSRFKRMSNFTNKSSATPNANKSIASSGGKDRIDEIRASISKLKHNGVGGIGKATSTLVRNQETGRYIIRDVDDESFDGIVLAEMMRPKILEESFAVDPTGDEETDQDCKAKQNSKVDGDENTYIGDVKTLFEMPSRHSIDGSVLSDGVVDEAVRAAIDAMSSTSTDDILESNQPISCPPISEWKSVTPLRMNQAFNTRTALNGPSSTSETDVDDFFVVARSSNQWSSFQSSANDNGPGSLIEDIFDINPSSDKWIDDDSSFGCAQWDDSGSDEWRDEKNSSAFAGIYSLNKNNNAKVTNFPSPTSVMQGPNRKFLKDGKSRQQRKVEVVPAWNPFDL